MATNSRPLRPFAPFFRQRVATFDELVGRNMLFKVTEVDEEKARLMLSNKRIAADERMGSFKVREAGKHSGGAAAGSSMPTA